jgi:hypothetical protein
MKKQKKRSEFLARHVIPGRRVKAQFHLAPVMGVERNCELT